MFGTIDIGGTKILAAASKPDGKLGAVLRRPTPDSLPVETLIEMLKEVGSDGTYDAIGISTVGPFDRDKGMIVNPPNLSSAWMNLALADALQEHFHCPVRLENDADCGALAEAIVGAGKGFNPVVYYTISTGIGNGVVENGRLYTGRRDVEAGHQILWPKWQGGPQCGCGSYGCLEAIASGSGLLRRFGKRAEEIDDPAIWEETGNWLGIAVINTVMNYDCEAIVFGGGVCSRWDDFYPAMTRTVKEFCRNVPPSMPPVKILRGALSDDRNLWGALQIAINAAAPLRATA